MYRSRIVFCIITTLASLITTGIPSGNDPDNSAYNDNAFVVVSLGDSYSSGEGVPEYYGYEQDFETKINDPRWISHRSMNSWPGLLKFKELDGSLADHIDNNWYFCAMSGATTKELTNDSYKTYDCYGYNVNVPIPAQFKIFDSFPENTVDYVTLTIGGNDVGFKDVIIDAAIDAWAEIPYLNPAKLPNRLNSAWGELQNDGSIYKAIKTAYETIHNLAGADVNIIVAGYPILLEEKTTFPFYMRNQAVLINEKTHDFNGILNKIVTECQSDGIKIHFVSVEEEFKGHAAYSKKSYLNEIILLSRNDDINFEMASAASMHPNKQGIEAYARCVQRKIYEIERKQQIDNMIYNSSAFLNKKEDEIAEIFSNEVNNVITQIKNEISNRVPSIWEYILRFIEQTVEYIEKVVNESN